MSSTVDRTLFEAKKAELISHMQRSGLLGPDADIEDVLALKVQTQLERRLQSLVHRKGLARSPKQARQLYHPRAYCNWWQARHYSGIPGKPERRDADLVLRQITVLKRFTS